MSLEPDEFYEFGAYRLNVTQRLLTRAGEAVPLAPKTFDLLLLLVKSPGRAFSKQELMTALWPDTFVEEGNLSFQTFVLRKALGEGGAGWLETIPKYGYRFAPGASVTSSTSGASEAAAHDEHRGRAWVTRWHASGRTKWLMAMVACSAVALTSYGLVSRWRTSVRGDAPMVAVPITAYLGFAYRPALSPDGTRVAFMWGLLGSSTDIYVKSVAGGEPQRLTTNPAWDGTPAWSPDGGSIAFMRSTPGETTDDLMVIPAAGGAEETVTTMSVPRDPNRTAFGLTWAPDGRWIALGGQPMATDPPGIWLIALGRDERRALTSQLGDARDELPTFSPDGTRLAFLRRFPAARRASVHVLPISPDLMASGPPTRVAFEDLPVTGLTWTPDGRGLVFARGNPESSFLQKVLLVRGPDEPIGQPKVLGFGQGALGVSVARSGGLVYSAPFRDTAIWQLPLGSLTDRPVAMPLLSSPFDEQTPDYSPDGKRLTFGSSRSGTQEIWIANSDGSNAAQMTFIGGATNPRWSPDGQTILFDSPREGSADLYLLRLDTRELRRLTDDPADEVEPRSSRDGRWIYFASNRTGRHEVWKMPAGGGAAVKVTEQGGRTATESLDGKFLYYVKQPSLGRAGSIWRVPLLGGGETTVVDGLSFPANFVVGDRGLYFVAVGESRENTSIDFVEHGTGTRTTIAKLGKPAWVGLALSPNQRTLLYSTIDNAGSNLMLVDGFR